MANLMRFDPFGDIVRFSPFGGVEDFLKDFQRKQGLHDLAAEPRIKMDVSETEQAYTVKAEIPGVKKEDIKVAIEGNQVSITAEIKKEKEEKQGESVVHSERYYGHQSRSFSLANEIDDTQAVAKYQDGVLELTLPKKTGNGGAKQLTVN